jgi:hypothetical protein
VSRALAALLAGAVAVACSGSTFTGTEPGAGTSGAGGSGGSQGGRGGKGSGGSSGSGVGGSSGDGSGGTAPTGGTGTAGTGQGTGGRGGASSGGNAGSGNASGSGGSGGASAGNGGSGNGGVSGGGVAGSAGALGGSDQGGTAGKEGAECETAADCQMVSDCCTCAAEPKGSLGLPCGLVCVTDACTAMQIERDEVTCTFGRCVIARSCDLSEVICEVVEPECASGTIPSVNGSCFGPCLPPTECSKVTSCADCLNSNVCVRNEAQLQSTGCVVPSAGCQAGGYCDCLGSCMSPFNVCSENQMQVTCSCLNC